MHSLGKNVDDDGVVEDKMMEAGTEAQALDSTMNAGGDLGNHNQNPVAAGIHWKKKGGDMGKLEKDFGRLVIEEGRSRYVSNSFWASLSDEVCALNAVFIFQVCSILNPDFF